MKRYFLSYGKSTGDYNLDYGCFDRNRTNLGKVEGEKLIQKIKGVIKEHRKSILYSDIGIEDPKDSLRKLLSETFSNTCIIVEFAKDLASLCKEKKTQKI